MNKKKRPFGKILMILIKWKKMHPQDFLSLVLRIRLDLFDHIPDQIQKLLRNL